MVTLFMLLIVNNWNLISANFVQVTSGAAYLYFMAFQIMVVTVGLNCVTSFFIGNLSNKLEAELAVSRPTASTQPPTSLLLSLRLS
jgi:hypothetical protein